MAAYADTMMIVGILILAFAFPTAVGAFSRGRPPRAAMLSIMVGGGLVVFAQMSRPGGYSVEEITRLFLDLLPGT